MVGFRLPRLRTELVTDKPASPLFRQWWESLVTKVEDNHTELTADITTLEAGVESAIINIGNSYLRSDGAVAASAATTTHKLTVSIGGATYYILLSNV
jgi:hypothetical protein